MLEFDIIGKNLLMSKEKHNIDTKSQMNIKKMNYDRHSKLNKLKMKRTQILIHTFCLNINNLFNIIILIYLNIIPNKNLSIYIHTCFISNLSHKLSK